MHGHGLSGLVLGNDSVEHEALAIGVECLVQEAGIELGVVRTLKAKLG